ncbi:MAG: 5-bromo-4-chloroindolyl phosphate hydrolysis family protein [Pseudomonadota bacterium]
MALSDGLRQGLAAAVAAGVFLGLYFGLLLVWWLALLLAVVVYFALILVVPRRRPLEEIVVGERVTAADLDAADQLLTDAATRIGRAAAIAPAETQGDLEGMALHLTSIRDQIARDATDFRRTRSFIHHHLPKMVTSVETYVDLASRSQGAAHTRLHDLGQRIRNFRTVVEKIDDACLENDVAALEAEVDALGVQMTRV